MNSLVERFRDSGGEISLNVHGEQPERVPEAVQLAAFRIVQESLTNVRRHALGAGARIQLAYGDDGLRVAIESESSPAGNGNAQPPGVGIIGMRERATAL